MYTEPPPRTVSQRRCVSVFPKSSSLSSYPDLLCSQKEAEPGLRRNENRGSGLRLSNPAQTVVGSEWRGVSPDSGQREPFLARQLQVAGLLTPVRRGNREITLCHLGAS